MPVLSFRLRILSTGAGAIGLAVLALNDPSSSGLFPPCIFLKLTGMECPGCGSTRCLHQLLNGNFIDAIDLNVLSVVALPWLLWRYGLWMVGKRPVGKLRNYRYLLAIGFVVVCFGILRNLDGTMFSPLAANE